MFGIVALKNGKVHKVSTRTTRKGAVELATIYFMELARADKKDVTQTLEEYSLCTAGDFGVSIGPLESSEEERGNMNQNYETFQIELEKQFTTLFQTRPEQYRHVIGKTTPLELAQRTTAALKTGSALIEGEGEGVQNTCKILKIKPITTANIKKYLTD